MIFTNKNKVLCLENSNIAYSFLINIKRNEAPYKLQAKEANAAPKKPIENTNL